MPVSMTMSGCLLKGDSTSFVTAYDFFVHIQVCISHDASEPFPQT